MLWPGLSGLSTQMLACAGANCELPILPSQRWSLSHHRFRWCGGCVSLLIYTPKRVPCCPHCLNGISSVLCSSASSLCLQRVCCARSVGSTRILTAGAVAQNAVLIMCMIVVVVGCDFVPNAVKLCAFTLFVFAGTAVFAIRKAYCAVLGQPLHRFVPPCRVRIPRVLILAT